MLHDDGLTKQRACELVGPPRRTYDYTPRDQDREPRPDPEVRELVRQAARERPS